MATIRGPLSQWLDGRTAREQLLLATGAMTVFFWILFTFAWQPIQMRRKALSRQIAFYEQSLATLQSLPSTASVASSDPRSLNVIITDAASRFGLTIRRLEPEGMRSNVTVGETAFPDLIRWLDALESEDGLRAGELTLTRRSALGTVDATLVLER